MSDVIEVAAGSAAWLVVLVVTGVIAAVQHIQSFNGELLKALHSLREVLRH